MFRRRVRFGWAGIGQAASERWYLKPALKGGEDFKHVEKGRMTSPLFSLTQLCFPGRGQSWEVLLLRYFGGTSQAAVFSGLGFNGGLGNVSGRWDFPVMT